MFEKIEILEQKYDELSEKINDQNFFKDQKLWGELTKEQSLLRPIVEKYRIYKQCINEIAEAEKILVESDDDETKFMFNEEIKEQNKRLNIIENDLKILLIPKDIDDDRNVIIEIRSGAGGDEASLFAYTIYRMYLMFAERNNWKVEILNLNEIGIGGIKEVSFCLRGKNVYSRLKFESGVHRVQRVPETESKGRVHTSTITVAVLPEVSDIEIEILPDDLEIDTFRASGAGGQHVNKTDSAIRIKHVPSGIVVACQSERSQHKNKNFAMKMLRSKLYEKKANEEANKVALERKTQVGSGDRSEKIRTYNFPQGRVTDHRINLSIYALESFLNGDINTIIDELILYDRNKKLGLVE